MRRLFPIWAAAFATTFADDACLHASEPQVSYAHQSLLQTQRQKNLAQRSDASAADAIRRLHIAGDHTEAGDTKCEGCSEHANGRVAKDKSQQAARPAQQTSGGVKIDMDDLQRLSTDTEMTLSDIPTLTSNSGQCLKFLHIPKNAGTTIELLYNMTKLKERYPLEANASVLQPKFWGMKDRSLKCSSGNRSMLGCEIADPAGRKGMCSVWHVPPVFDSVAAASYAGCNTFCVVRHPLMKAISQHLYTGISSQGGKCNGASFAETAKNMSDELPISPFKEDCHWVPQVYYIANKQHCQHPLRFEYLRSDFNTLMADYNIPLVLGKEHNNSNGQYCNLTKRIEEIPIEAIKWVEMAYAEDYEAFGYPKHDEVSFQSWLTEHVS